MNAVDTHAAASRVRTFFERLAPADLDRLGEIYAAHAYFRDPFNEVRGLAAIRQVFEGMFGHLAEPRFRILETVVDERAAMLTWDLTFRFRRYHPERRRTIHGASHLRFDASGRVTYHRDYWDAADELYAQLPVVGALMRYLKRRMG